MPPYRPPFARTRRGAMVAATSMMLPLASFVPLASTPSAAADDGWGRITVVPGLNGYAELENSVLYVRYGRKTFDDGATNHVITHFVLKSTGVNQAGEQLDGIWLGSGLEDNRGALTGGTVVYDGLDRKTVRLVWGGGRVVQEISMYPDSPILFMDYINYGVNVVDIGSPGGRGTGVYRIYGQERWRDSRYPDSYYNAPEDGDPFNGGPLSYYGWGITGIYSPANGVGFARVVPIGGDKMQIIKLLFNAGFEMFPWYTVPHERYFQWLFGSTGGGDGIIRVGQQIVDAAFPRSAPQSLNTADAQVLGVARSAPSRVAVARPTGSARSSAPLASSGARYVPPPATPGGRSGRPVLPPAQQRAR